MHILQIFLLSSLLIIPFGIITVSAENADSYPRCSDINHDGIVNILDLSSWGVAWTWVHDSRPGDPNWNATYDLNDDGVVNIADMVKVALDFGMKQLYYMFDEPKDIDSWNSPEGTWNILEGSLEGASTTEGLIYAKDMALEDCLLTARVKILADSPAAEVAFFIRFVDTGNCYWAGLGCWGHRVSISRTLGYVYEELISDGARTDVDREVWYKVSVRVSDSTIMLYVDDVLELTVNDSTFTSGMIGIRTWDSHVAVDYVTVSYYTKTPEPSLRVNGYGLSWDFGEYNAEAIVETFGMSQSWARTLPNPNDYTAKMNAVHALNPNYKALVYRNMMSIYDYWTDEWNTASINGWLLKDASGAYVTEGPWPNDYAVDITDANYQTWVANKIHSWIIEYPFFNGVMCDNSLKYNAAEWEGGFNSRPINPATGTYFTDSEILTGCAQMLNATIAAVGSNKIVLSNGIWNGEAFYRNNNSNGYWKILSQVPQLSGIMSEAIFHPSYSGNWYSEEDWKKSLDMLIWVQNNFLARNSNYKFAGFVPACYTAPPPYSNSLPTGATRESLMMFGYCSMMLGVKYDDQNVIGFGSESYLYPECLTLAQQLCRVDMIQPLTTYYKIGSTSVYGRDFVAGKILVNPSNTACTVSLGDSYRFLNGTTVTNLTLVPHSGQVLLGKR